MPIETKTQQLHAVNTSPNLHEALEARVKDALWFLARQYQTGEFEAESGGRPANVVIKTETFPFQTITAGGTSQTITPSDPLEALIEAESETGDAAAWNTEALEYSFGLAARGHDLDAHEYDGRALDWHDFDLRQRHNTATPAHAVETVTMVPNQLTFPGAPNPRWWEIEEGDAYFESPQDPEPNMLSMLLPEFTFADVNNWYIIPAPMQSGALRRVSELSVVDSFGTRTNLGPVVDNAADADWALFALDGKDGGVGLDGATLMAPNIALQVVENDEIEEVRFMRDESANLVWAWERQIIGADGETVSTNSERPTDPQPQREGTLPEFRLKSPTARAWIPYVARHTAPNSALNGDIALRRGRTDETATPDAPQYRSKLVAESEIIAEEQIPLTPLRVRRVRRYARGSDGEMHFWVGRDREVSTRTARTGLKFDYLDG